MVNGKESRLLPPAIEWLSVNTRKPVQIHAPCIPESAAAREKVANDSSLFGPFNMQVGRSRAGLLAAEAPREAACGDGGFVALKWLLPTRTQLAKKAPAGAESLTIVLCLPVIAYDQ